MRPVHFFLALALATAGLVAAPARAGIPAASTSTVPARVFLCPAGDSMFVVLPRHLTMDPWGEGEVWVGFCDCAPVRLSPAEAVGYVLDAAGCVATAPPMPAGIYAFPLAGGGLCPDGRVSTWAGGVLLADHTSVVSPDQNGDLIVDAADVASLRAKLGTADPGADLDGDGAVTQSDVDLAIAHLGHASRDRLVPALPASWGRIKLLYR